MEKIEKISAIVISAMVVISGIASTAIAYDADNPWTGTVLWSIPSDTSFTVTFAGSQTQINFTASSTTENLIEPDGQDAANTTPIITIENTGNTELDFYCNLTSAKPSWATIKVRALSPGVVPDQADAIEFNTTPVAFLGFVNSGQQRAVYFWSNITNASGGDTTRTLMISASIS